MSAPIDIDFETKAARPPTAGIVLLALGLVTVVLLGWQYRQMQLDITRMEARLDELRGPGNALAPGAVSRSSQGAASEFAGAQLVVRQLSMPWNDLFAAVEGAMGSQIALIGIQPEASHGRVTISAEAKDMSEALWFAQRLSASGVLTEAFLTGHEVVQQGAQRPVRVTISAQWPAMEGR